jgi:hypothetical protein
MESFKWLGGDMSSHDKELLEAALEEQVNSAESKDEIVAQLGINPDDHRRQATFFAKEIDFLRGEPLPHEPAARVEALARHRRGHRALSAQRRERLRADLGRYSRPTQARRPCVMCGVLVEVHGEAGVL